MNEEKAFMSFDSDGNRVNEKVFDRIVEDFKKLDYGLQIDFLKEFFEFRFVVDLKDGVK